MTYLCCAINKLVNFAISETVRSWLKVNIGIILLALVTVRYNFVALGIIFTLLALVTVRYNFVAR